MPRRLSDAETMLWNLDQHPQLASTMGSVITLDSPPDPARLRSAVIGAIAEVPALREYVRPSPLPLAGPEWVVDHHLDLDHHLRWMRLAHPPSRARLLEVAAQLINDPFDPTRPLWQLTVVTGLPRGRAAMVTKLHHAIADGQGAVALAANLLEFDAHSEPRPPRSLDDVLGNHEGKGDDDSPNIAESIADGLRSGAERLAGFLTDAAGLVEQPGNATDGASDAMAKLLSLGQHLPHGTAGSSLWARRSRNRRIASTKVRVAPIKQRARELDVSLNDLFVGACSEAAVRHHERRGHPIGELTTTVVISTRQGDDPAAMNAVMPVAIVVPGTGVTPLERLAAIREQVLEKRAVVDDAPDLLGTLGSIVNLVPGAVTAAVARDQAARVDFATSNLPGPPVPVWLAGTRIRSMVPIGPVAGTAFNATLMTYLDDATIGLHVDPAAVGDPAVLADDLDKAFGLLGVPGHGR